ncbi:MAG: M28 family metallopeptidase [Oligoflexales bacterium]
MSPLFFLLYSYFFWKTLDLEVELDGERLVKNLKFLTSAPHPLGSAKQEKIAQWLTGNIANSWDVETQVFFADTPNPQVFETLAPVPISYEKKGYNIIASQIGREDCWIFVGSHYDTKIVPNTSYVGANDGASTTALLLELSHVLQADRCGLVLLWFDGEEPVLKGWSDGEHKHPLAQPDHTYGSRSFITNKTKKCGRHRCFQNKPIESFILLDMLGSSQLKLTQDLHSSPKLVNKMIKHARDLQIDVGFEAPVEDDHIPFLQAGIPSVNMIDFHNIRYWHREGDTLDTLSMISLKKSFRLAFRMVADEQGQL